MMAVETQGRFRGPSLENQTLHPSLISAICISTRMHIEDVSSRVTIKVMALSRFHSIFLVNEHNLAIQF